jgi:hypothetical protein
MIERHDLLNGIKRKKSILQIFSLLVASRYTRVRLPTMQKTPSKKEGEKVEFFGQQATVRRVNS